MAAHVYERTPFRFAAVGLSLNAPPDLLALNRVPFLQNVREYQRGRFTTRAGVTTFTRLPHAITTLSRLNDSVAGAAIRLYGLTDGTVYTEPAGGGGATILDTAYSGNPLTIVDETPPRSPQPWAYIADSTRMRKTNIAGLIKPWGLAQPLTAPNVALDQPAIKVISDMLNAADWTDVGVGAGDANVSIVNTTVASILYDSGVAGYCSIVPTAFTNIIDGGRLFLNASERVIVDQITIKVASGTIAQIVYDVGTTGLCTIQPTASLGVGQLVSPPFAAYAARYATATGAAQPIVDTGAPAGSGVAPAPDQTSQPVSRQVDFPVNCLVVLNPGGGTQETVRILSVVVGTDGTLSFRCATTNAHGAGDGFDGVAAFRCYTIGTVAAAQTITGDGQTNTLTPVFPAGATQVDMVGGMSALITVNGATVATNVTTRAVLPDDILHMSVKVDYLQAVNGVRIYLDVDDGTFLRNYYFFEWRANDLISAVQATNAGSIDTIAEARLGVVTNQQIDPSTQPALPPDYPSYDYQGQLTEQLSRGVGQGAPPGAVASTTNPFVGDATASNSTSLQLALANNQWVCLRVRIGDLTRVGGNTAKSLADIMAVEILVAATSTATIANPLIVGYSALYIEGGFGPNTGSVGVPYAYVAVPRDAAIGVTGNPSPPSRGGVAPLRQQVLLTPPADAPAAATIIDWYRIGGLLDRYTYVGTSPNNGSVFKDVAADVNVSGGQILTLDNFQPWPTTDQPRTGIALVAGSAMQWISGDVFNLLWAPGTAVVVNGFTVTIDQVLTTTRMLLRGNAGAAASVNWTIANPTLLATSLPAVWGDHNGVYFACGDTNNPGSVYWCKRDQLDMVSDAAETLVTGGGDQLQHGYIFDTESYVASTNDIYRLDDNGFGQYIPRRTPGSHGFWTRWAFDVDDFGCYFLASDGIYLKVGGGIEQSITDADLYPLFPHDGIAGVSVNGIDPPDMTQTTRLRIAAIDTFVYFDYADVAGHDRTLVYDTIAKLWLFDKYATGIYTRLGEPGAGVHNQILGGSSGAVMRYTGMSDNGVAIASALSTRYADGGDVRRVKQFGDVLIKADAAGGAGITSIINYNDAESTFAAVVLGAAITGLALYPVNINGGDGVLARNLGVTLTWVESLVQPAIELWEPSFLSKVEDVQQRATDWDDLGYAGAKFIQGVVIRANTYGAAKSISVEYDGGTVALVLSATHTGEVEIAYPLAAAGWLPFMAQLVRLVGDEHPWQLYAIRWVFEPAPELATEWHTQPTTHNLPGYLTVRDAVIAYSSSALVLFSISYDGAAPTTYTLPATAGVYARFYQRLIAAKGRSVTYTLTADVPFRVYQRDCAVRIQGWGGQSGYSNAMPFGGPSRMAGAQI